MDTGRRDATSARMNLVEVGGVGAEMELTKADDRESGKIIPTTHN